MRAGMRKREEIEPHNKLKKLKLILCMIDKYVNDISKFVREHNGIRIQGLSDKINERL